MTSPAVRDVDPDRLEAAAKRGARAARVRADDIEECVAEAIARYFERAPATAIPDPYGWVHTAAHNYGQDIHRREQKLRPLLTEDEDRARHADSAEVRHFATESLRRLSEVWPRLSRPDQEIFQLRVFDDLPSKEVARRLGITIAAVDQRLARARARLHKLYCRGANAIDAGLAFVLRTLGPHARNVGEIIAVIITVTVPALLGGAHAGAGPRPAVAAPISSNSAHQIPRKSPVRSPHHPKPGAGDRGQPKPHHTPTPARAVPPSAWTSNVQGTEQASCDQPSAGTDGSASTAAGSNQYMTCTLSGSTECVSPSASSADPQHCSAGFQNLSIGVAITGVSTLGHSAWACSPEQGGAWSSGFDGNDVVVSPDRPHSFKHARVDWASGNGTAFALAYITFIVDEISETGQRYSDEGTYVANLQITLPCHPGLNTGFVVGELSFEPPPTGKEQPAR